MDDFKKEVIQMLERIEEALAVCQDNEDHKGVCYGCPLYEKAKEFTVARTCFCKGYMKAYICSARHLLEVNA